MQPKRLPRRTIGWTTALLAALAVAWCTWTLALTARNEAAQDRSGLALAQASGQPAPLLGARDQRLVARLGARAAAFTHRGSPTPPLILEHTGEAPRLSRTVVLDLHRQPEPARRIPAAWPRAPPPFA